MKIIKKMLLILGIPILLIMMLLMVVIGGNSGNNGGVSNHNNLSAAVENYRSYVTKIAKQEKVEEYVDLILAVMQVESGGSGSDPMQSSEGPFNKRYPQVPNGIKDPTYSIVCGIQEVKDCLKRAHVKDASDEARIRVALGGYNFGNGFIEWIDANKGGKWSLESAEEFSEMMAAKMGWPVYGDPPYADKVMSYYQGIDFIIGTGDMIPPMKKYALTSAYGNRPLGDFHFGIDLDGGYGAAIYAPIDATVYQASGTCPVNGGYLGNMCPYDEYMGGGNYIMLKTRYKEKDIYIFMCHMENVSVKTGQKVKQGQRIGTQGHSGNSTASHLHLEMHEGTPRIATQDGSMDPKKYIKFN